MENGRNICKWFLEKTTYEKISLKSSQIDEFWSKSKIISNPKLVIIKNNL